ncbi:MAG TPA: NrfD/PsrC family molybdoenzyme membrane anchor subunit [Candidatus Limnocylindria bacterium]|nr:NrfD/PsrC family molybdoenzyme membrane anchor subunit [Candidatus Limnocylindria bacterium]
MDAVGLPSTFFTAAPDWRWLIVLYFFIGGLAGGTYFLAFLIDLFGRAADRPLARLGYYVAFPAVVVSGFLLIVDLTRPLRFWHMMIQSNTGLPMFKAYSPMSLGSWALLLFGAFALLGFLSALAEAGRLRWSWLPALRPPGGVGTVLGILGGLLGVFIAGYTGVLLAVTNRPIWADTPLLGLTFLVSAASTSAALLILLAYRRHRVTMDGVRVLERFDSWVLVFELIAIVALVVSLGSLITVWLNTWGLLLLVGVMILGILVPLALHWRPRLLGPDLSAPVAAALVLFGGFVLRVVIVLSSEGRGVAVLLLALALTACASPEARRVRGGDRGADVGNVGTVVEMHEGSKPYHGTPDLIAGRGTPRPAAQQAARQDQ